MPSTRVEPIDRPRTLLPTHQVSDFSRNFAQLEKDSKRPYSLRKVIRELSDKPARLSGFEMEVNQELQSLNPVRQNTGTLVPIEAFGVQRRDLTIGTIPTVQTTVSPDEPIPFLRVKSVCGRCGCTMLDGLSGGNISLPRATATAGAGWYGETGPISSADQSLDNITLSPKLISGSTIVSNQLLRQSSPDIEAFIVRDISEAIAIAVDQAALFGAGSATVPKGIMTTRRTQPAAMLTVCARPTRLSPDQALGRLCWGLKKRSRMAGSGTTALLPMSVVPQHAPNGKQLRKP